MINITITGAEAISSRISGIISRLADLTPAFETIRGSFWDIEEEQFSSEGGFSGGWQQLSPGYDAWKKTVAPGMPILQLSGDLMRSLTGQSDGTIAEISPMEARFGTSFSRGLEHQTGKDRLPARPPLEITDEHRQQWVQLIEQYINGGGAV